MRPPTRSSGPWPSRGRAPSWPPGARPRGRSMIACPAWIWTGPTSPSSPPTTVSWTRPRRTATSRCFGGACWWSARQAATFPAPEGPWRLAGRRRRRGRTQGRAPSCRPAPACSAWAPTDISVPCSRTTPTSPRASIPTARGWWWERECLVREAQCRAHQPDGSGGARERADRGLHQRATQAGGGRAGSFAASLHPADRHPYPADRDCRSGCFGRRSDGPNPEQTLVAGRDGLRDPGFRIGVEHRTTRITDVDLVLAVGNVNAVRPEEIQSQEHVLTADHLDRHAGSQADVLVYVSKDRPRSAWRALSSRLRRKSCRRPRRRSEPSPARLSPTASPMEVSFTCFLGGDVGNDDRSGSARIHQGADRSVANLDLDLDHRVG